MPSNFRSFIHYMPLRHPDMLNERHFAMTMLAALMLHMLALYVWHLMPKPQVIEIPVRALNIKLGDGDAVPEEEMRVVEPRGGNYAAVENTISKLVRDQEAEAQREKNLVRSIEKAMDITEKVTPVKTPTGKIGTLHKFDMRSEGIKAAAPVMEVTAKQFVRDLAPPSPVAMSTPAIKPSTVKDLSSQLGNSKSKEAELVSRYEQMISLWVQKFKLYPEEARSAGMQGETVVRIRIDRRGNIRYYTLDRSTGHVLLDRAAIDMIRRANPVPAVPGDYPPGDILEFLIPVNFQLQ